MNSRTQKVKDRNACVAKLWVCCTVSLLATSAANAQAPSQEMIERLRSMGYVKGMKTLPAISQPKGMNYSHEIPTNFPVAVYRSNVIGSTFVNSTSGAASAVLAIATKDPVDTVYQFYTSALRSGGWQVQIPTADAQAKLSVVAKTYMLRGTKDIQVVTVTIRENKKVTGTNISINWCVNREGSSK